MTSCVTDSSQWENGETGPRGIGELPYDVYSHVTDGARSKRGFVDLLLSEGREGTASTPPRENKKKGGPWRPGGSGAWVVLNFAEVERLRTKGKSLFWEFSFNNTDRLKSGTTC